MEELQKYFDSYSLNARVKPAFFVFFPVVISTLVLYEPSRTWGGSLLTLLITFGAINFAANQMSSRGNQLQEKLFKKWGGAPTTIILRHSDNTLDRFTKSRYMQKLSELVANFTPTTAELEREDPQRCDQLYQTASNYLREYTRDSSKYPLIFKENTLYGFSRNIRAFKLLGVALILLCLTIVFLIAFIQYQLASPTDLFQFALSIPVDTMLLTLFLFALLLIWLFYITDSWVKLRGFAYAKRLYAACEHIPI